MVRSHCLALFSTPAQQRARVYGDLTYSMSNGHSLQPLSPVSVPLSGQGIWEAAETRNIPKKNGGKAENCLL